MFTTENINLSDKDISRFWAKVRIGTSVECWPWTAGKTKFGHGIFSIRHKWIIAHRVSFFIKNGYLPNILESRMVMHDCENPECQNPNHLLDGTNKQNQLYKGCLKKHKSRPPPMLGRCGLKSPRWGTKHTVETKAKIREKALARGGWKKANNTIKSRGFKWLTPR